MPKRFRFYPENSQIFHSTPSNFRFAYDAKSSARWPCLRQPPQPRRRVLQAAVGAALAPATKGLHSFTFELNLSNSRTHS